MSGRAIAVGALLLLGGCAALPRAGVKAAPDGSLRVEVLEEQTVRQLAVTVYGDLALAEALAEAAGLPPREPVAAGTVLELPGKAVLKNRLAARERAEKLVNRGRRSEREGRFEDAQESYREAVALDAGRADARTRLGLVLLRTGQLEEAHELLVDAAARHPGDAEVRHALGVVLRERGDLEGALAELEAAVNMNEHHARAALDRARTLHDLGRLPEARRAYERFLFAFPADPFTDSAREALEELSEP